MLHARRQRLRAIAEAEAQGTSFWTSDFDERVRTKLKHAFDDACMDYAGEVAGIARSLILRDEGLHSLGMPYSPEYEDLLHWTLTCDSAMVPSTIEAMLVSLRGLQRQGYAVSAGLFREGVRTILAEHRISFDLVEDMMVEFESKELHTEVVVPTLRLLAGRARWAAVEAAYQKALSEIGEGDPSDAITDAGTALQEALVLLGCDGNALGPLVRSARGKGLLASHDSALTEGISKILNWVSADRSETGDSHRTSGATPEDAWLTVHVVGALILRLASSTARGAK